MFSFTEIRRIICCIICMSPSNWGNHQKTMCLEFFLPLALSVLIGWKIFSIRCNRPYCFGKHWNNQQIIMNLASLQKLDFMRQASCDKAYSVWCFIVQQLTEQKNKYFSLGGRNICTNAEIYKQYLDKGHIVKLVSRKFLPKYDNCNVICNQACSHNCQHYFQNQISVCQEEMIEWWT